MNLTPRHNNQHTILVPEPSNSVRAKKAYEVVEETLFGIEINLA